MPIAAKITDSTRLAAEKTPDSIRLAAEKRPGNIRPIPLYHNMIYDLVYHHAARFCPELRKFLVTAKQAPLRVF